jgi:hypothetical protein
VLWQRLDPCRTRHALCRGCLNFRIPRDILRLFDSIVVVILLLALLLQLLQQRLVQDRALPLDAVLNVVGVHPLVLHLDLKLHQLVLDLALLVVQRQFGSQLLPGPLARQQRRQRVVRRVAVVVFTTIILASSRCATVLLPVPSLLVTMPVMIGTEGGPARLDVPRGGGPPHRAQADAVVHAAAVAAVELMIARGFGLRLVYTVSSQVSNVGTTTTTTMKEGQAIGGGCGGGGAVCGGKVGNGGWGTEAGSFRCNTRGREG